MNIGLSLSATTVVLLTASAASAAGGLPGLTQEGLARPEVRPAVIVYTGDGSGFLAGPGRVSRRNFGRLRWTSWTRSRASGSGANWINDCTPDCAQGHFHGYPVTLFASRPRTIAGHDLFTRLRVTYTGRRPSFVRSSTQTWKLEHRASVFFWQFPS